MRINHYTERGVEPKANSVIQNARWQMRINHYTEHKHRRGEESKSRIAEAIRPYYCRPLLQIYEWMNAIDDVEASQTQ
jgi:hypothetical protein